jgi:polar amino acid transport system substrate-binding protein
MKQVAQDYNSGELRLQEVPMPVCKSGGVVVRSMYSLVSTGTELMKIKQARMSLLEKARSRPDKVAQVIQSVKQKGLSETINLVRERLNALTPIGYSLSGVVEEVGSGIDTFAVGDRVACAGEGVASHAEFVSVPRNLCVAVPDGVDMRDAAYTTVGAIALQGVRQAGVTVGDSVVVLGLGLIGLLAVQILKGAGCRVVGVDFDPARVQLAKACGADAALVRDDPSMADTIAQLTGGAGVDVVYVAASTQSSDPMDFAGEFARDRGKVVIVGMVNVEADWRVYYGKELSIILSRSYGPGRYDPNYENKGVDYPIGYVRWTEGRNMEEFLRLIRSGVVTPSKVGQKIFSFSDAAAAYDQLHKNPSDHPIGILFEYPKDAPTNRKIVVSDKTAPVAPVSGVCNVGIIGAGNFTSGTLVPAVKSAAGLRLAAICSAGGLKAKSVALGHDIGYCASDYKEILADANIQAVVIATHHDTHARFTVEALRAEKHVFVEKPLALSGEQLDEIIQAQSQSGRAVMTGFNRSFSPLSEAVRDFFAGRQSPIEVTCRVNAGAIKADSWYKDAEEGGWRILSEGCHFVDLVQFLCQSPCVRVFAQIIGGRVPNQQNDNCNVSLRMADGSIANVLYVANGDPYFEKERVEAFGQNRAAVIDNWRCATLSSGGKTRKVGPKGTGKGHKSEMAAFAKLISEGGAEKVFRDNVAVTRTTLAILESIRTGLPVDVVQSQT